MGLKRILIVDDEPRIRGLCLRVLRRPEFSVTCVSSVDEALTDLERDEFDLLITDIRMPRRDGLELVAEVKSLYRWLPVIVISGFVESAVRAKSLGIDVFLMKPFQPSELLAAVQDTLGMDHVRIPQRLIKRLLKINETA